MNKLLIPFLIVSLISCDSASSSTSNKDSNIRNACLEMNATSIGFTGPSKRIDIMKNYGFSLDEASTLNFVINQTYEVSSAWSFDETKSDCLMDTYSCPLALTAISNGSLDQYTKGWETRLRSCNIVF